MEKINQIEKLIADLESGKITCREIMEQTLQNIKQYDKVLDCYISVNHEKMLLEQADAADKRCKEGKALSKIDGVPVAIKDNITVQGLPTTCGSRILEGYNSPYESTAADALRKAGAIIVGKTNMDEFAMGSTSETSAYHKTRNPYDAQRVPGGSSGGSASAVAAGLAPFALGSDTGGSIRQPAAF
jgi:aspartyl-tRNA(Asn)/glutamyl-tRNA(Gln) amidotransferase subunit A